MNQFAIVYMVNPTLNFNKVFRKKVDKRLKETVHPITISGIRNIMKREYVCYCSSNVL